MNTRSIVWTTFAACAVGTAGCAHTVRVKTAGMWWTPGAGPAPSAAAAPADGSAAPAAPAAPSAAGGTVYYVSHWEGECGGLRKFVPYASNCSAGDGKVLRCNLNADNSVTCVEEPDANRALATE